MNNELSTDVFVNDVINAMIPDLTPAQSEKLKNILYINLHGVVLERECFDLATTVEGSDAKKLEYFAVSKTTARRSKGTIRQYMRTAWDLRTFVGKDFADISALDIKYYLATKQQENHWSDSTIHSQRQYLNAFFKFLYDEEFIARNPMNKVESVKCEQILKKPFTSAEIEAIRNACFEDSRKIALIEFMYATGLRVSNIVAIKWGDLDMFNRKLQVRLKGGKEKEIFFNERSAYYLLNLFNERLEKEGRTREEMMLRPVFTARRRDKKTHDYEALTTDGIRHVLKEIGQAAGVGEIHPHKFRRTFACGAINHGMPLEDLKEHMGHSNYDTTLRYAKITTTMLERSYRMYCE